MDISAVQKMVDNEDIIFLSYGAFVSQTLISEMTGVLEKEVEGNNINVSISNNIISSFIELSQNIMNYFQTLENQESKALILVAKDENFDYHIHSQNIVSQADKEKIESKLLEIQSLDKEGIKSKFRDLRRSGKNTHSKGGGIGFYEMAKKCDLIDFNFKEIQKDRYYFHMQVTIVIKI